MNILLSLLSIISLLSFAHHHYDYILCRSPWSKHPLPTFLTGPPPGREHQGMTLETEFSLEQEVGLKSSGS